MQFTLTAFVSLLALSPLTLAADSSSSSSSKSSSSVKPSSSPTSKSSSKGPSQTPTYTITGLNSAQSDAYASFTSSRGHDSSARSSLSALTASATETAALSSFDPYGPSVISVLQKAVTATGIAEQPKVPTDLPKGYQTYWSSVYKAEINLLTKQATNTSNAAVGMPTAAVMAAGAGLMGAIGLAGLV